MIGPSSILLGVASMGIMVIFGAIGDVDVRPESSVGSGTIGGTVETTRGGEGLDDDEEEIVVSTGEEEGSTGIETIWVSEGYTVVGAGSSEESGPGNVTVIGTMGGGATADEDERGHGFVVVIVCRKVEVMSMVTGTGEESIGAREVSGSRTVLEIGMSPMGKTAG